MTHRAIARFGFSLAFFLTASAGLAQDAEPEINKAEQLMADILIGMAQQIRWYVDHHPDRRDPPEQ